MTKSIALSLVAATAALSAGAADLQFLRELVEIPSASANIPEVNRAQHAMKAYLERRGLVCTLETDGKGHELLFAATQPGKVQDYILSCHLDVVPAAFEGHYALKNDNGRLTGRGAGDDKGGAVAVAETLAALVGKGVSVGCVFGGDEEIGGYTTKFMVEEKGYRPRKMAIVVDGYYDAVCIATKGQLQVRVTVTGPGGHSSMPWRCDDVISRLAEGIVKVRREWYRRHPLDTSENHWSDVLTPTVIRSEGDALNRIPEKVWVNFNLRSVRNEAKDECIAMIRELCGGEVEVVRYSPPCICDGNHPLVRKLQKAMEAELGHAVPQRRMMGATDARWFTTCGVPIVNVGHMHGDSHAATEWSTVESIDVVTRYLTAFLLDPSNR